MERLAEAIILAAKIREDSWDNNINKFDVSISCAAATAAKQAGFDSGEDELISTLLYYAWNETLHWARNYKNKRLKTDDKETTDAR